MAVNLEELVKNEFWHKKMTKELSVRDADKDGFISRSDFQLIIQRYKDMGSSEEHLKKLNKNFDAICFMFGVKDEHTKLSFEQCIDSFSKAGAMVGDVSEVFTTHFEIIDSDGNGEISYKEWVNCYKALDIDTAYARASFDACDTNGDGIISKEEFAAYAYEFIFTAEDKLKSSIIHGPLE